MTREILKAVAVLAAIALAGMVHAQGRHDEKPHGPPAKEIKKSNIKQPVGVGRHDEKPHGPPPKADPEKKK